MENIKRKRLLILYSTRAASVLAIFCSFALLYMAYIINMPCSSIFVGLFFLYVFLGVLGILTTRTIVDTRYFSSRNFVRNIVQTDSYARQGMLITNLVISVVFIIIAIVFYLNW